MLKTIIIIALLTFTMQCKHSTEPTEEIPFCQINDSTSHDFSWQVDTVGLWPSVLHDVDAIDENNVWAVGEIVTADSDSVWHNPQKINNAVKWNGKKFEYYQLEVMSGGGNIGIQALLVSLCFSQNNIWFFSDAGSYVHWNGNIWNSEFIQESKGIFSAGWGISGDDFYIVGHNGSVTRYDGNEFTLMDCGTDKDLHDITGYIDPETGLTNLWVAGEEILLHYDGKTWTTVWDENTPLLPDRYHPGALYAPDSKHLVVAAWHPIDIYGYCINSNKYEEFTKLFNVKLYPYSMCGLAMNDIFISGSYGEIAHFNGKTAKLYSNLGGYNFGVTYLKNNVYIVGYILGQQGIFIHGTRK